MIKEKLNIGIFGIGAIGVLMAKIIEELKNAHVFYFSKNEKTKLTLQFGTDITEWGIELSSVNAFDNSLDYLFICLKEFHYHEALNDILQIVSPETLIVSIRNGIHLKQSFDARFNQDKIIPAMIDCSVDWVGEHHYQYYKSPKITMPNGQHSKKIEELLGKEIKDIFLVDYFHSHSWKKLIESSCLGAIMVLSGSTAKVFQTRSVEKFYIDLVKEAIQIANLDGAKIHTDFIEYLLKKLKNYPPEKGSSMLTDLERGRPLELNAKNGAIVQAALRNNYPAPLHNMILRVLKRF